ncbi:MAG: 16S rRNA (adenine(1518)-N(6)/adenine(1519)-N(6))-dimethyltransferase RsmA [bacterium]
MMRANIRRINEKNNLRSSSLKGIAPKKKFGQNFMVDKGILTAMVKAGKITGTDLVVEVGPGTGNLTNELLKKAMFVIAVEKDRDMCRILKQNISPADQNRLAIIEGDIRDITINQILNAYPKTADEVLSYKVVANLPYYVANPVIRFFLENKVKPESIVVMIQKEVGERIIALPPNMTLLSVSIQFYGKPRVIRIVPKGAFWPQPRVDSAILEIIPHNLNNSVDSVMFFDIVRAGFRQPRKQLINNLPALAIKYPSLSKERILFLLKKNNLSSSRRAETLTITDWVRITESLVGVLPNKS